MAAAVSNPVIPSNLTRLTPSHARTSSRSPSRSPIHRTHFITREVDPLLSNLSPDSTLRALEATDTIVRGAAGQDALARSIADASTSERKLGIRAAVAAQKLRQWRKEVTNWPWPEKRNQALGYGFLSPRKGTTKFEYLGSLPLRTVQAYEERLEEIKDAIDDLGLEEVKEYVFSAHVPSSSSSNGSEENDLNARNYGRMRDFTALITATVVQALPDLADLSKLLQTWDIRVSVLREVPELTASLETVQAGVDTATRIVTDPIKGKLVSREEVTTTRYILGNKISNLGSLVDKLLDLLEGEEDTLPQVWIDTLEDIESKYSDWVVEADQVVLRNEMNNFDETVVRRNGYRSSMAAAQFAKSLRDQRNASMKGFTRVSILSFPAELAGKVSEQQSKTNATTQNLKPEALTLNSNSKQSKTPATKPDHRADCTQIRPHLQGYTAPMGHVRDQSEISLADSYLSGFSLENAELIDARSTQVQSSPIISIIENSRSSEDELSWFPEPSKQGLAILRPNFVHSTSKPSNEVKPKVQLKTVDVQRTFTRGELRKHRESPPGTPAKALQQLEGRELQPPPLKTNHQQIAVTATESHEKFSSSTMPPSNKAVATTKERGFEHETADTLPSLPRRSSKRLTAQLMGLQSRPTSRSIDDSNHSRQTSNTVDDSDYSRQTSSTVADSIESRPTSYSVQDVKQTQPSSRNPIGTTIVKPISRPPNHNTQQNPVSKLVANLNSSRPLSNSSADGPTTVIAPRGNTSANQDDFVQKKLEGKIQSLLKTLPMHVQMVDDEDFLDSHTDYFSIQKRSISPSAVLILSPMKRSRLARQDVELGVRGFYLSQVDQSSNVPPVKLLVRAVGETRDRVVVRVGGRWVDLLEYLHDYSLHNGGRNLAENKFDFETFPSRKSSLPAMSPISSPTEVPDLPIRQNFDLLSPNARSPPTFEYPKQQVPITPTSDTSSTSAHAVSTNHYPQRLASAQKAGSVSPRPRSPTATTVPKLENNIASSRPRSPRITVQPKKQANGAISPRPRSPTANTEYLQNHTYGAVSPRPRSPANPEPPKKQNHGAVPLYSRSPIIGVSQKPTPAAVSPSTQSPVIIDTAEKPTNGTMSPRPRSPTTADRSRPQIGGALSPRERSPTITEQSKKQAQGAMSPRPRSPAMMEAPKNQANGTLSPRPRSPVAGEAPKKQNLHPFTPSRLAGKSLEIPRSPQQGSLSPSLRSPTSTDFPSLPISRSASPGPLSPTPREPSKPPTPIIPGVMYRPSNAGANKIEPGTTLDFNTWRARKSSIAMWQDPKAAPPPVPAIPSLYTGGTNTPMGGSTTNLLAPTSSGVGPKPTFRRTNSVGPSRTLSNDRWANPELSRVQGLGLSLGYSQSHENLSSVHMMKNTSTATSTLSTMSRQPSLRRPSSRLWRSRPESQLDTHGGADDSMNAKSKNAGGIRRVFGRKKSDK